MINDLIFGVKVSYDENISIEELNVHVSDEIDAWKGKGKELASIELTIDGDEIVVKAVEKSPVRRVRRITGYLSNMENFNDAKQAELAQRHKHM